SFFRAKGASVTLTITTEDGNSWSKFHKVPVGTAPVLPDIFGMTETAARSFLQTQGFTLAAAPSASVNSTLAPGLIVDSTPPAGTAVAPDSPVEFRVSSPAQVGIMTTIAPPGRAANPAGIGVDGAGNIYVAANADNQVKMFSPTGVMTVIAGTGASGN